MLVFQLIYERASQAQSAMEEAAALMVPVGRGRGGAEVDGGRRKGKGIKRDRKERQSEREIAGDAVKKR